MLGSQIISKISQSLNIGSQVASFSHSNLLNSRVEFVASDTEHAMTVHALQSKYHQLGTTSQDQQTRLNGQYRFSPNKNAKGEQHPESHLVGKEENGMPLPRVVLYNPGMVQLEWKQSSRIGAGLVNLGNTCFMNTVIQCLTYCTPLANYLLHQEEHTLKCKLAGFCMLCEMQKHMKRALDRHGQSIKPMYIYQKLKSIAKHFQFGRQEDAHEFLRYVIDNLWKSCLSTHEGGFRLDPASKETTVVNQIFGGYNRSQVVCLRCHGKSNTFDHFMDLILDIKNVSSLQSALEKFVQAEMLEDENAYKCPKCGTKVRAEKKFTVHKPPNVATFQFKRFDYNRMFGGKITKTISYPEKLDLRPFMSDTQGPPVMYKLNSVLVHVGNTCNSGHYYCYVRNSNGCWYLMDDTRVHQVGLDQVLQQQAYVLFYVRVPSLSQDCIKKPLHKISVGKNGKVTAQPNENIASMHQRTPLATRPTTFLQNGNKQLNPCRNSPVVVGHQPREKISFGIRRPSIPATNGPHSQKSASTNGAKILVPYGGDSSENSSDDSPPRSVMNGAGVSNSSTSVAATDSKPPPPPSKEIFEHPNKCERSPLPKIGTLNPVSRSKATASWHVLDLNLQSPSVASESSNNSVNSTTDWSVVDRDAGRSKERAYVGWSVRAPKQNREKSQEDLGSQPSSVLANGDSHPKRTSLVNGGIVQDGKNEHLTDGGISTGGTSSTGARCEEEKRERVASHRGDERKRTWTHPLERKNRDHKRFRDESYGKESRWQQRGGWEGNRAHKNFYESSARFGHRRTRKRHGSGTSNSSYETEWVERTKETVQQEKHRSNSYPGANGKFWNDVRRDGGYKTTGGRWDGSKHSDAVDELLHASTQGYGVCTWNGNRSWMDQEPIRNRHFYDDYDDEYDRGKVRKERKRHSDSYGPSSYGNPFQRFQNAKTEGRPYGGFNSFQQKNNRWGHFQDRYNNRSFGGFPHRHNNRYGHR